MSFRLFVYYCALVGAWTGVGGWLLGRTLADRFASSENLILQDGLRGLFLGMFVAFGLGLVDAVQQVGWRRYVTLLGRLFVATGVGAVGGFVGGGFGQWLVGVAGNFLPIVCFFVLGWSIAGLLIGASLGAFDWLVSRIRNLDRTSAKGKLYKCVLGGGLGGLVGGLVAYSLRAAWTAFFSSKDPTLLWSPTAIGFVALGLCIGLLVGLTQVYLKSAWLKVEAGFRPGRELILTKDTISIGREEGSDIALFGDPGVEKRHAQIVLDGVRYAIEDAGSAGGTFVNDRKISGRVALRSGDAVRVGKSVLRFSEKQKR